jgi:hypothetical protein
MSESGDSPAQVAEVPDGVDPLDALEQLETGSQDPTPHVGDAAAAEPEAPASAEGDAQQPQVEGDQPATRPGQEEWLVPGQFRNVEEVLEAHRSLREYLGRQSEEIKQLRAQGLQYQAPQPHEQAPAQPYMPAYQHPPQGYTAEQIEQLQYENPAQLADYFAMQRAAEMVGQLMPSLAPLMESVHQQEARHTVEQLRREFGDETVERHSEQLARMIQQDEDYFLSEQTRVERFRTAIQALEFRRIQTEANAQPRAADGTFAAKPPAPVHVEPGGGTQAPPVSPADTVDPVIAGMRGEGVVHDRFGHVPPELARRR